MAILPPVPQILLHIPSSYIWTLDWHIKKRNSWWILMEWWHDMWLTQYYTLFINISTVHSSHAHPQVNNTKCEAIAYPYTKFREKKVPSLTGDEQAPCKEQGSKPKKTKEEVSTLDLKPHICCLVEARKLRVSRTLNIYSQYFCFTPTPSLFFSPFP
jgi:hypothetical protein